jgi:protein TonB
MNEQLDQSEPKEAVKTPAPRRVMQRSAAPRPHAEQPAHHAPRIPLEEKEDGFFVQHRTKMIVAVILIAGAAFFFKPGKGSSPQRAPERMMSITLPPMPPPPPPPKVQPPPPKEEKMVEQAPVAAEEKKVEAPKPPEAAPAPLGTGIKGNGPGTSGLGGSGEGGGVFGGGGSGGGGSKWGFFASQVQSRVAQALRGNKATKSANLKVQVRIWADSTGRVTRAQLDGSTGDRSLDTALQNEVLTGLQLSGPPPAGMPMPIVMRLTGRRP